MQQFNRIRYEGAAAHWFKETFRTHDSCEYSEFLNRGVSADNEGLNKVYPWVYARVFFLCLVLFAAFAVITDITYGATSGICLPTLVVLGAMLINAPIIVLIYELYPWRDLVFLKICLILVAGGAVSVLLINLGYMLFVPNDMWLDVVWTAFVEEVSKAIPAVIAVAVIGKRNPLKGFIIGAAVGVGMSVAEDMGYILFNSISYDVSVSSAVTTSFIRALTSLSGHLLWTGLIGWAFGKFRRPLVDIRFWGVCAGSMALHFIWDFPLAEISLFTLLGAFVGGLVIFVLLVKNERSAVFFAARGARAGTEYISDGFTEPQPIPEPVVRKFNGYRITAVICAIIACVCGIFYCIAGKSGGYDQYYFYNPADFLYYVQCGNEFSADDSRPYDERGYDWGRRVVEGKTVEITQMERKGGVDYYYTYSLEGGSVKLTDIAVKEDGEFCYCSTFDGLEDFYFFNINPEVLNCYYDDVNGEFIVYAYTPVVYYEAAIVFLGALAGLAIIAGLGALIGGFISERKRRAAIQTVEPTDEETDPDKKEDEDGQIENETTL